MNLMYLLLHHADSNFIFNRSCTMSLHTFLDNEALNFIPIRDVLCPNNCKISNWGISWPSFLSINDVTSFNFLSSCCHACCVTSIIRLSETKACNLFERNKIREELIFLCITATVIIYLNTHRVLQEKVQSKTHITESEFVNHTT